MSSVHKAQQKMLFCLSNSKRMRFRSIRPFLLLASSVNLFLNPTLEFLQWFAKKTCFLSVWMVLFSMLEEVHFLHQLLILVSRSSKVFRQSAIEQTAKKDFCILPKTFWDNLQLGQSAMSRFFTFSKQFWTKWFLDNMLGPQNYYTFFRDGARKKSQVGPKGAGDFYKRAKI